MSMPVRRVAIFDAGGKTVLRGEAIVDADDSAVEVEGSEPMQGLKLRRRAADIAAAMDVIDAGQRRFCAAWLVDRKRDIRRAGGAGRIPDGVFDGFADFGGHGYRQLREALGFAHRRQQLIRQRKRRKRIQHVKESGIDELACVHV